ncbi:coiled-coil domain-containing protein 84-like [Trachypithecus francoisi]|uniref:coiled-coil domain-containing protein 84-like n=1 Tax=Trachypithecus francoisi TaxID=54180 RepID=UPI00141A6DBD|nr:coiled-coil domain-containing protein 84-like [Trachypithecus francoisi]
MEGLGSYEEKENEVTKEMAAQIREVEQSWQEVVQSVLEVGFPQRIQTLSASVRPRRGFVSPWKLEKDEQPSSFQLTAALQLGPATAPGLDWMETRQSPIFIGHQDIPGVGNIHSGATPPWMIQDEGYISGNQRTRLPYKKFIKEKEKVEETFPKLSWGQL